MTEMSFPAMDVHPFALLKEGLAVPLLAVNVLLSVETLFWCLERLATTVTRSPEMVAVLPVA